MKKIFSLFMLMLLMAGFSAKAENEIYAVLDPSIHCLNLYYDDQKESRGGVTNWGTPAYMQQVTWFDLDESMKNARPTSTQYWFSGYANVTSIRHLEYLNTSEVIDMMGMFSLCSALTTVDLRSFDITNVTNMISMFHGCTNLTTIYCKGNWSATTANSYGMFNGCTSLVGGNGTTYDPNHIDASYARLDQPGQQGYFTDKGPEVYALYDASTTTMTLHYDNMCLENGGSTEWWKEFPKADITTVILDESMQEARPERITSWFKNFHSLTEIQHLDYLNTSEVTDMSIMFYDCFALTQLDLSNFNTSNVTDMSYMFWECSSLTQLDLGSFNTSNVTDMSYMFAHCYKLETIELRSFDISNVTSLVGMFFWCSKLNNIHCNANWSTTTAETGDMFGHCEELPNYDPTKLNGEYARPNQDGQIGYFTEREPFYALYDAETTTMTIYHGIGITTDWWNDFIPFKDDITTAVLDESMQNAHPKSTQLWFASCINLTEIQHLEYLNTSEVTDMSWMFRYCYALTSVDLRSFDVTNVTDMYGMFEDCYDLKTIYCGGNWSATTADTQNMFKGCVSLVGGNGTTYDPNHIDASYARLDEPGTPGYFALEEFVPEEIIPEEVIPVYALYDDISGTMTLYCDNQHEENGGSINWSDDIPYTEVFTVVLDESMKNARPRSTSGWFYYFTRLREIQHLDYLNTSEVTDMSIMFRNCERLTTLDLRSFDISKVTDMSGMFDDCSALKTIYCNDDWSATLADSESMFKGCTSIVGGNGTTYDADHTDASYARYDEPGAPGYFTVNTTGIEEITPSGSPSRGEKVLLNGELYILRGEEIFNAQGGRVK